mgnify:FL=1
MILEIRNLTWMDRCAQVFGPDGRLLFELQQGFWWSGWRFEWEGRLYWIRWDDWRGRMKSWLCDCVELGRAALMKRPRQESVQLNGRNLCIVPAGRVRRIVEQGNELGTVAVTHLPSHVRVQADDCFAVPEQVFLALAALRI